MPKLSQIKPSKDPRHYKRIRAFQAIYAWQYGSSKPSTKTSKAVIKNIKRVDKIIQTHATKWPLNKINQADLSILRLSLWEIFVDKKTPYKVAINEAVELAKEFGAENSPGFVNGVLGSAVEKLISNKNEKTTKKT